MNCVVVEFILGGALQKYILASEAEVIVLLNGREEVEKIPDVPHLLKVPLGEQGTVLSWLEGLHNTWSEVGFLLTEYRQHSNVHLGSAMARDPRLVACAITELAIRGELTLLFDHIFLRVLEAANGQLDLLVVRELNSVSPGLGIGGSPDISGQFCAYTAQKVSAKIRRQTIHLGGGMQTAASGHSFDNLRELPASRFDTIRRGRVRWSKALDEDLLIRAAVSYYRDQLKALRQRPDHADMDIVQRVEVELELRDNPLPNIYDILDILHRQGGMQSPLLDDLVNTELQTFSSTVLLQLSQERMVQLNEVLGPAERPQTLEAFRTRCQRVRSLLAHLRRGHAEAQTAQEIAMQAFEKQSREVQRQIRRLRSIWHRIDILRYTRQGLFQRFVALLKAYQSVYVRVSEVCARCESLAAAVVQIEDDLVHYEAQWLTRIEQILEVCIDKGMGPFEMAIFAPLEAIYSELIDAIPRVSSRGVTGPDAWDESLLRLALLRAVTQVTVKGLAQMLQSEPDVGAILSALEEEWRFAFTSPGWDGMSDNAEPRYRFVVLPPMSFGDLALLRQMAAERHFAPMLMTADTVVAGCCLVTLALFPTENVVGIFEAQPPVWRYHDIELYELPLHAADGMRVGNIPDLHAFLTSTLMKARFTADVNHCLDRQEVNARPTKNVLQSEHTLLRTDAKALLAKLSHENLPLSQRVVRERRDAGMNDGPANSTEARRHDIPQHDPVECSVFSVPEVYPGDYAFVQVFAHLPERGEEAIELAKEFDADAKRRGIQTLNINIRRGSRLTFHLEMKGASVDKPVQELTWLGKTESVQFEVRIPDDYPKNILIGKVTVACNSVPVGNLTFKLKVIKTSGPIRMQEPQPVSSAKRYDYVFISYASKDRSEVLRRVQMLDLMKIRYFQDILSLDPGDRWEKKLYEYINLSDAFLLFWSRAAKESEWVLKEVRYALQRKGGSDEAPPEILPVIIEGPPIVEPPEELREIHFNDRIIYFSFTR
jgi:hypothetical protein